MNTNYNKQATDFLTKFELSLSILKAVPQSSPLWAKDGERHGINYWCILTNKEGKHYEFNFWDSISNAKQNKRPCVYDVLSCLNTYDKGASFSDFCNEYGYDTDSRTAEKTFIQIQKQIEGLEKIMPAEALDALNEIQ